MPTAPGHSFAPRHSTCTRTRLAESEVAAVDYCECGHMHLHLGPFSLRITPEALSGLLGTLGHAVATHAALGVRGRERSNASVALEASRIARKRGVA